jgi:hypothetical protein
MKLLNAPAEFADWLWVVGWLHSKAGHKVDCQLKFCSMFRSNTGRLIGEMMEQIWVGWVWADGRGAGGRGTGGQGARKTILPARTFAPQARTRDPAKKLRYEAIEMAEETIDQVLAYVSVDKAQELGSILAQVHGACIWLAWAWVPVGGPARGCTYEPRPARPAQHLGLDRAGCVSIRAPAYGAPPPVLPILSQTFRYCFKRRAKLGLELQKLLDEAKALGLDVEGYEEYKGPPRPGPVSAASDEGMNYARLTLRLQVGLGGGAGAAGECACRRGGWGGGRGGSGQGGGRARGPGGQGATRAEGRRRREGGDGGRG